MHGAMFWEIFIPVATLVFILPTIVGLIRGANNITTVILFNILALVSFGVGWIAAMGFALIGKRESAPVRVPAQPRPVRRTSVPDYDLGSLRGTPFESLTGHVAATRSEK